jgi:CRISPR-associated helicase Cas3
VLAFQLRGAFSLVTVVPVVKHDIDFLSGFAALTGNPPYPWQQKLFDLLAQGEIPPDINLPTGSGKTSIMPIWLLALAHQAQRPESMTLPRRPVWVVNRRVVVDQATEESDKSGSAGRECNEDWTRANSMRPRPPWSRKKCRQTVCT